MVKNLRAVGGENLTCIAVRDTMQYVSKSAKAFRLSDRAVSLIDRLADELGLSKTGVVELAVRRLAEIEGVVINDERLRDGDASPRQGGIPPPRL